MQLTVQCWYFITVLLGLMEQGEGKPKTTKDLLAMLRDQKRRRQSYRAKNVHITKKSYTEVRFSLDTLFYASLLIFVVEIIQSSRTLYFSLMCFNFFLLSDYQRSNTESDGDYDAFTR